jgi:excisionase family DNA binding protein
MEEQKATLNVDQAARMLGISRGLAYEMAKQNRLPIIRCGHRRILVPRAALERMLADAGQVKKPGA